MTAGQNTKNQTFSNLQCRLLLRSSSRSIHIDTRDRNVETETLLVCWYHSFRFDNWKRSQQFRFDF